MSLSEQIKGTIDIPTLWARLGYPGTPIAGKAALCPFHAEKSPSCHIRKGGASFHCFGCGAGGSVIDFYKHGVDGMTDRDAILGLAKMLNLDMSSPEFAPIRKKQQATLPGHSVNWARTVHKRTDPTPAYLAWAEGKGIQRRTVDTMIKEGSLTFRDGFPVYIYNGGEKTRFDVNSSKSSRWTKGSPVGRLWRKHRLSSWENDIAIVCEGESDTMLMEQTIDDMLMSPVVSSVNLAARTAVVGLPNANQTLLPGLAAFLGSNRIVIICLDSDLAGRAGASRMREVINACAENTRVILLAEVVDLPEKTDLCDLGQTFLTKTFANLFAQLYSSSNT